mmetsp:Transcript_3696/g.9634  ORF Transcript_3696/g.9634 Transcript_3696/m.9634 type:complete len:415 (+) Transcript_3696:92-1336(+)
MPSCKGIILVGGASKGTRFRPLSMDIPKPLFPVAGRPMIHHHVRALASVPEMKEIILLGFYEPAELQEFIESATSDFGIPVRYLQELKEMGTAGGLHRYADSILAGDPGAVFLLHGDIGCEFPLSKMLGRLAENPEGVAVILGKQVGESEAEKYGQMVVDEATGELLHYAEKNPTHMSAVINCGVYLFSPSIFTQIAAKFEDINRGRLYAAYHDDDAAKIRLEQDILMVLAGRKRIYTILTDNFWCQVKTPAHALALSAMYLDAADAAKKAGNKSGAQLLQKVASTDSFMRSSANNAKFTLVGSAFVHPTAKVSPLARIGPNAAIGPNAEIGPGVRLRDCIILDNVIVKDNAMIKNAIVGWGSNVGYWTRLQGTEEKPTILGADVTADSEIVVSSCVVLPHKGLKVSLSDEIVL